MKFTLREFKYIEIKTSKIFIYFLLFLLTATSCDDRSNVKVYKVEKNKSKYYLDWVLPKHWYIQEDKKNTATFFFAPELSDNLDKEISIAQGNITILEGSGGSLIPNINRWRGQIGLKSITGTDVKKITNTGKSPLGEFNWFEISNKKNNLSMITAIISLKNKTIFIKLLGDHNTIISNKDSFFEFVKSIHKNENTKYN